MKKLCFVTAARSEYGLLKWLMHDVRESKEFQLQLVVTGGHLLEEQGHTIDQILEDGFLPDAVVDVKFEVQTKQQIAITMGTLANKIAEVYEDLKPDYLVVLGDRYELLPVCGTAFVMGISIVHISGGDVTEGALDNGIRNSISMLATYHFPGTSESAERLIRMRGEDRNIWAVGEPGLDFFYREQMLGRTELSKDLNLRENARWAIMTYHAETTKGLEYNLETVKECIEVLKELKDFQTVITYSNADFGGEQINRFLKLTAEGEPEKFKIVPSLGQKRYLSLMRQVSLVIGNSSSGIVEAPFLHIPVVNIGDRQKGRYQCENIIQTVGRKKQIEEAIQEILSREPDSVNCNYWGDGHTSERILNIMKSWS